MLLHESPVARNRALGGDAAPLCFGCEQNYAARRFFSQVNGMNGLSMREIWLRIKKHYAACPCSDLRPLGIYGRLSGSILAEFKHHSLLEST